MRSNPEQSVTADVSAEVVVIEPARSWFHLGLRDLWRYRELLYFLVWRDIKVRYKQTVLGALWAVLQPLVTAAVFTVVFGRLAGIGSGGVPYPVFALAALLPWTFFAQGVTLSSNSLVGSAHLITKVFFPRILIPTASVLSGLVDLAIAFVVFFCVVAAYGMVPSANVIFLPLMLGYAFCVTLAVGLLLSAVNVRFRDVRFVVPFAVQIWLFLSPVIYPAADLMQGLNRRGIPDWVYALNPMVGVIEGFRWGVFGGSGFPAVWVLPGVVVTLCGLLLGVMYFRRTESSFADIV